MRTDIGKYDLLIEKVKSTTPEMRSPERVMDGVMAGISARAHKKDSGILIRITAICASVAATLLIGLFINESIGVTAKEENREYMQRRDVVFYGELRSGRNSVTDLNYTGILKSRIAENQSISKLYYNISSRHIN